MTEMNLTVHKVIEFLRKKSLSPTLSQRNSINKELETHLWSWMSTKW
ncbi:1217_t:CDS:1, partial [Dentiscutata heterogama]